MKGSWDFGFRDVTGNNLWLLTRRPGASISYHGLSSNGPGGKKWVVTKTVDIHGKPVCWCIPVEVKTGGPPIVVTFAKDNTFDLRSVYDNAMREPVGIGVKE
jgi:hypothetical protein